MRDLQLDEKILFEVTDVFGVSVRTTKVYWQKIITEKHQELSITHKEVIEVLRQPDEVYRSVQDPFIKLFYKLIGDKYLIVLVKYIQERGFVVTCYQTTKTKRKGEKLWPV